ncbi:MAG: prolyl oligopeptidase family serine peptidase [Planctomycetaceae bacterium]|nr:prolyl oligopeptidase family serine peptidase [Planctomycetaceae bacterium]
MKTPLTTFFTATLALITILAYAETLMPGRQVVQSVVLPANTAVRPRQSEEERVAEKARRDALPLEERDAEDKERHLKSFEEMRNPKPLSETEMQTVAYWLFLPNDYELQDGDSMAGKTWPLLLFLHGSGERGNDIDKVKVHGPPKLLDDPDNAKDWPFITVSPQCPDDFSWSPLQLGLLIDELEKQYAIDCNRVYVTGLSMGGFGTWGLLYHFPNRFAAGVPICGGFDPEAAERFTDIPLWVFHGTKDSAVKVTMSTDVVEAIQAAGGRRVRLTVYPDLEHDSWTVTYDNPELYRWLLEQNCRTRSVSVFDHPLMRSRFRTWELLSFELIKHASALYKATHDHAPESHEEFVLGTNHQSQQHPATRIEGRIPLRVSSRQGSSRSRVFR